jgi:hypothetical protein
MQDANIPSRMSRDFMQSAIRTNTALADDWRGQSPVRRRSEGGENRQRSYCHYSEISIRRTLLIVWATDFASDDIGRAASGRIRKVSDDLGNIVACGFRHKRTLAMSLA